MLKVGRGLNFHEQVFKSERGKPIPIEDRVLMGLTVRGLSWSGMTGCE